MGDGEQGRDEVYRGALRSYLRSIRGYPLLTASGEQRLAKRRQRGENRAHQRLVSSNLRLVVKIAREYSHRGAPIEDLISEGNLGLIEAAKRFEPNRGARFVTYASWWIRKYVIAAANRQRHQASAPVPGVRPEVEARDGHAGPLARVARRILSFGEISRNDERTPLEVRVPSPDSLPDSKVNRRQVAAALREALSLLGERERRILELHYGLDGSPPKSLQAIADEMGCTREWVRQLEHRTIERARGILESRRFKR
jgi:RNA polymerase sigma factor (sigma-70 family)